MVAHFVCRSKWSTKKQKAASAKCMHFFVSIHSSSSSSEFCFHFNHVYNCDNNFFVAVVSFLLQAARFIGSVFKLMSYTKQNSYSLFELKKKSNVCLYFMLLISYLIRWIASHCFYLFICAYWRFASAITLMRALFCSFVRSLLVRQTVQ